MEFILLGVKVGGAYAIGEMAGGRIAAGVNLGASDGARRGIKIATGVAAFLLLSLVLR
jgi:hypothetical protein